MKKINICLFLILSLFLGGFTSLKGQSNIELKSTTYGLNYLYESNYNTNQKKFRNVWGTLSFDVDRKFVIDNYNQDNIVIINQMGVENYLDGRAYMYNGNSMKYGPVNFWVRTYDNDDDRFNIYIGNDSMLRIYDCYKYQDNNINTFSFE